MTMSPVEMQWVQAAMANVARIHTEPLATTVAPEGGIPLAFSEPAQEPKKNRGRISASSDIQAVKKQLDTKADGVTPQSNLKNAIRLLRFHPAWNVPEVLFYDEFSLQIYTRNPPPWGAPPGRWTDVDDIRLADWFQTFGVLVSPNVAADAVQAVARETTVHPVKSYLHGQQWDRCQRVISWLTTYLGVEDSALTRAMGKGWLVAAVARIFRPGCQADYTLSLEGPQGLGKSSALRTLAGDQWFSDHLSDLANKDSRIELLGKWIVELSELGPVRRAENDRVKQFLTARFDYYRPPYARRACQIPRQCVFAASFNDQTPFSDTTGNRRFWPIACRHIDVSKLEKDRDQLWAEAYELYKAGAIWWLDSPELNRAVAEEQAARLQPDAWDDLVLNWAADPQPKAISDTPLLSEPGRVTVAEILAHAVGKGQERWEQSDENRIARILVKSGWKRKQFRQGSERSWFYVRPDIFP